MREEGKAILKEKADLLFAKNLEEDYLIEKEGRIAGAASDVFAVEPAAKDHPLLQLENFIGTPHSAAHTEEALKKMSLVAVDILRVLEGKEPVYPVNRPR